MVGRASIGKPWVFEEMKHYLSTGELLPPKSFAACVDILKEYIGKSIEWVGDERRGIVHVRRHLAASPIFKGIPDFKPTRIRMLRVDTLAELFDIFEEIERNFIRE